MDRRRWLRLAAIATLAGLFSGLFGVGGGTVMVPLLVVWMGFDGHRATGTSLAAIVVIAAVGVVTHLPYGNVHVDEALLVGLPAVAGVVAGAWLQQRLSTRVISLAFAVLLLAAAVELAVG